MRPDASYKTKKYGERKCRVELFVWKLANKAKSECEAYGNGCSCMKAISFLLCNSKCSNLSKAKCDELKSDKETECRLKNENCSKPQIQDPCPFDENGNIIKNDYLCMKGNI
jgi:hypothetical protein